MHLLYSLPCDLSKSFEGIIERNGSFLNFQLVTYSCGGVGRKCNRTVGVWPNPGSNVCVKNSVSNHLEKVTPEETLRAKSTGRAPDLSLLLESLVHASHLLKDDVAANDGAIKKPKRVDELLEYPPELWANSNHDIIMDNFSPVLKTTTGELRKNVSKTPSFHDYSGPMGCTKGQNFNQLEIMNGISWDCDNKYLTAQRLPSIKNKLPGKRNPGPEEGSGQSDRSNMKGQISGESASHHTVDPKKNNQSLPPKTGVDISPEHQGLSQKNMSIKNQLSQHLKGGRSLKSQESSRQKNFILASDPKLKSITTSGFTGEPKVEELDDVLDDIVVHRDLWEYNPHNSDTGAESYIHRYDNMQSKINSRKQVTQTMHRLKKECIQLMNGSIRDVEDNLAPKIINQYTDDGFYDLFK